MDRASAFVLAVSAGCVTYDRGMGRALAGSATAIAWEHSAWLPEDVPLHELVHAFLSWQYDAGAKKPDWARTEAPAPYRYGGPIDVGMRFIWGKDNPKAWADVTVTRIDEAAQTGASERRVWTRHTDGRVLAEWDTLDANARMVRRKFGVPNDESRFREMVTPWQG